MAKTYRYWATFRLKHDAAYDKRYQAMIDALNQVGTNFWQEPTSFFAFDSTYSIDAIAGHVKKAINPAVDIVVITLSETNLTRYIGNPEKPVTFAHHFPVAKKV